MRLRWHAFCTAWDAHTILDFLKKLPGERGEQNDQFHAMRGSTTPAFLLSFGFLSRPFHFVREKTDSDYRELQELREVENNHVFRKHTAFHARSRYVVISFCLIK